MNEGKQCESSSEILTELPYNSVILLLSICPKELKMNSKKYFSDVTAFHDQKQRQAGEGKMQASASI